MIVILTKNDQTVWNSTRACFDDYNLDDIYFSLEYMSLYVDDLSVIEGFLYKEGGEMLFFPYFKRKLPDQSRSLCDFETVYGYAGPLSTTQDADFLKTAWEAFYEHARREQMFAGFIRFHPLLANEKYAAADYLGVQFVKKTVMMDLCRDEETVWRQYRSDTRNKIRKAEKNRVIVEQSKGLEALLQFGKLYHQTMADIEASEFYFFGDDYFRHIGERLDGHYDVYLAYHNGGKCVGGVLTLNSKKYVHLHLSATDRDSRQLGTANLLRHTAIMANLRCRTWFHFGGGIGNDETDNLFRFKSGFSQELADFWVGEVMIDEPTYRTICAEWEKNNPDEKNLYRHKFLKYRL